MYYEINVALNGKHFFATDERSITNETKLKEVYAVIRKKFPTEEGYTILVSRIQTTGTYINMEQENSL